MLNWANWTVSEIVKDIENRLRASLKTNKKMANIAYWIPSFVVLFQWNVWVQGICSLVSFGPHLQTCIFPLRDKSLVAIINFSSVVLYSIIRLLPKVNPQGNEGYYKKAKPKWLELILEVYTDYFSWHETSQANVGFWGGVFFPQQKRKKDLGLLFLEVFLLKAGLTVKFS